MNKFRQHVFKFSKTYISRMTEIKLTKIQKFLENKIPKELLAKVKRAFEVVGDIAITEIEEELVNMKKK